MGYWNSKMRRLTNVVHVPGSAYGEHGTGDAPFIYRPSTGTLYTGDHDAFHSDIQNGPGYDRGDEDTTWLTDAHGRFHDNGTFHFYSPKDQEHAPNVSHLLTQHHGYPHVHEPIPEYDAFDWA